MKKSPLICLIKQGYYWCWQEMCRSLGYGLFVIANNDELAKKEHCPVSQTWVFLSSQIDSLTPILYPLPLQRRQGSKPVLGEWKGPLRLTATSFLPRNPGNRRRGWWRGRMPFSVQPGLPGSWRGCCVNRALLVCSNHPPCIPTGNRPTQNCC